MNVYVTLVISSFITLIVCFAVLYVLDVLLLKSKKNIFPKLQAGLLYCSLGLISILMAGYILFVQHEIIPGIVSLIILTFIFIASLVVSYLGTESLFKNIGFHKIVGISIAMIILADILLFYLIITFTTYTDGGKNFDAKRMSELNMLRTSLVLYYDDHNNDYPSVSCGSDNGKNTAGCIFAADKDINPVVGEYMAEPIKTVGTREYIYKYDAKSKGYMVYVLLENYNPQSYYCLDSTGKAERTTIDPRNLTICP